jgi:hypothetical protein
MEMTLDYLKTVLVPTLFPSDEDGNPDNYDIDFYINEATNELMISLESKNYA